MHYVYGTVFCDLKKIPKLSISKLHISHLTMNSYLSKHITMLGYI